MRSTELSPSYCSIAKLSPADQKVLREVTTESMQRLDAANRVGEENARDALRGVGIEFVDPASAEELERWRDITRRALVELRAKGVYSDARIDELLGHLEDFRRSGDAGGE